MKRQIVKLLALLVLLSLPAVVQAQFSFTTNNGAITITKYTGSGGNVVIPSTTNGYPVTIIGTNAFFQAGVTRVTIPNSVTNIGDYAFSDCSGLTNVTIPNSIVSIGTSAFASCPGPKSMTIPDSVIYIGDEAFYECWSLTSVTIGIGVFSIGNRAFGNCHLLTNITVNMANPNYASAGGVLFNKSTNTLVQYPGGLTGNYTIPTSVTNVGGHAFAACSGLKGLTIPNSVRSIEDDAFAFCDGLTNVVMGSSVTSIGNEAFHQCSALTEVAIPNSVTSVGTNAFWRCFGLANVTIGNSVNSIGSWVFQDCARLTNIGVNTANQSYASAGGVLFNKTMTTLIKYPEGLVGSYAIPNGVTSIGVGAFAGSGYLWDVDISNSVTSIGDFAFNSCYSLTSVVIPDSVTNIGNYAFYYCSQLDFVTIGSGVTSIGERAFYECSSLSDVTIPNSVTSIGNYTFEFCDNLHQAYFNGNAPSINGGAGSTNNTVFWGDSGMAYFVPGTAGWGAAFGGWLTAQWYQPKPQILGSGYGLGVQSNGFQFTISWATNTSVVVEASTNLQNWTPVITNTLIGGTNAFGDFTWTNYPQRFYRVHSP